VEPFTQGKVRFMSAERIVAIMKDRQEKTGNNRFFFQDDTFLAARGRLEKLHETMRKENLLGKYEIQQVSLNTNLVKDETIALLKEIGVRSLGMGAESLNASALKRIKRGLIKVEDIERTITLADKAKLPIGGAQVYGMPGETRSEMVDSIERAMYLESCSTFKSWGVYVCQPLPGSLFWEEEFARGRVTLDMDFSTLRIDGDDRFFASPWFYDNEANVSRDEFIDILQQNGMVRRKTFTRYSSYLPTRNKFWLAGRVFVNRCRVLHKRKRMKIESAFQPDVKQASYKMLLALARTIIP
jgi:radical SAM superfamily enzyme YgiQ (UPF0313 family)